MESIIKSDVVDRYTVFPIKYPNLWSFYKKHAGTTWFVEEVRLTDDLVDWNEKLTDNERFFIKNILAFFAASDGIVNENLVANFYNEVQIPEARNFYAIQMMIEAIHCVAPETLILTDSGYLRISSLENRDVNVWNGYKFSNVRVVKTSDNSKLLKVSLSNGMELDCTEQHKWHIKTSFGTVIKYTKDLNVDDILKSDYTFPVIGNYDFNNIIMNSYTSIGYVIPINHTIHVKIKWLEDYFDKYGVYNGNVISLSNETPTTIQILKDIQLLLTTMNILSSIKNNCLYLSEFQSNKLFELGFKPRSLQTVYTQFTIGNIVGIDDEVFITSIKDLGREDATYCFNEPENHTGIFNGILTGQSEQYSLLIDTYIQNQDEKNRLFSAIETIPAVKKKADWAIKWIEEGSSLQEALPSGFLESYREIEELMKANAFDEKHLKAINYLTYKRPSFAQRLLAFVCVEGLFFSGSFCAIYWLKNRGLMPGLSTANNLISKDENLHCSFAIELYKMLDNKLDENTVHTIFKDAVSIEKEFITESLPVSLIGMNCTSMSEYIEYVADRWLILLGYNKIYNTKNPFGFMELISVNEKTNFFENDVNNYQRPGIGATSAEREIVFDDEF